MANMPYDSERDFAPVSLLTRGSYLLAVHRDVPARTMAELIALARARPGELTFASAGSGAGSHLAGELLCMITGVRMTHIPYRGTAQAVQDVAAGRVTMSIDTYGAMIPLIQAGNLRPVAVTSGARYPDLPEVPTIAETIPGFEVGVVNYMCVRAGTPQPIIVRLNQALVKVLADPGLAQRMAASGQQPTALQHARGARQHPADRGREVGPCNPPGWPYPRLMTGLAARAGAMPSRGMEHLPEILELDSAGNPPQGRIVQIFQVACRLFATRGFDGVSMRDIAAECGISKATLYHYFPDKDSILRPLAMGTTKSIFVHVQKHDDPTRPPLIRLRVFLTETANFFEKFRWAWIAGSTAFWSDPKARARKERIGWRDRYELLLREILQAGIDAGEIEVADVRMAGRFVLGSVNWMARWYDPKGPLTASQIADQFCDMIVTGIQAKARPRRR